MCQTLDVTIEPKNFWELDKASVYPTFSTLTISEPTQDYHNVNGLVRLKVLHEVMREGVWQFPWLEEG
jgi:hypothetical protein